MHVEPGMVGEPCADRRCPVGAVVIADEMDVQVVGDLAVDLDQELAELDGAVPSVQAGDHCSVGGIERREQGGSAVPDVVVGAFSGTTGCIGSVFAVPSNAWIWRLLLHTQHYRVLRRCQIQPDDVGDLRDQLGVGGELERLRPPRLHPCFPPRLGHGAVARVQMVGQQPRRPVGDPQPASVAAPG